MELSYEHLLWLSEFSEAWEPSEMSQVSEPSENPVDQEVSGRSNIFGIVGTIFIIGNVGIWGMSRFFGTSGTFFLLLWFCF